MQSRKRVRNWLLVAAALAGVIVSAILLVPGKRLLLANAREITKVDNGSRSPVLWLSEQNAILMPYHADGDRFEFVQWNVSTGVRTPLEAINSKYRSTLRS